MGGNGSASLFLLGWTAVMVAIMALATPSLTLLYRTIALKRLSRVRARTGTAGLFAGYIVLWAAAGVLIYPYQLLLSSTSLVSTSYSPVPASHDHSERTVSACGSGRRASPRQA